MINNFHIWGRRQGIPPSPDGSNMPVLQIYTHPSSFKYSLKKTHISLITIFQWNCRGLRSNREDIELLISKYSPAAICLQETLLTPHQTQPPRVLLLCRSWGACVPRRSQRLCQLEFWLLVGTTMLDRLWARGQTRCNTPLMLATSVFGRIHRRPCYVMAQLKSRLNIPWPNDAECMGHVWCHLLCWYPLFCDVESLAGYVRG